MVDPHTGKMHLLTEEFLAKRPEAANWPTFRVDEVVTIKGQDFTVEAITSYGLKLRTLPSRT